MNLLLLLTVLETSLSLPYVKTVAFSTAPYITSVDPYSDFTCPIECMCYKVNETTSKPSVWINCTVSHVTPNLLPLINEVSNPLTAYAFFTCAHSSTQGRDYPPESRLWDGTFQKMSHLRTLVFDRCKFRTLSKTGFKGLLFLSELVIRDAAVTDLDPDLLVYLPQLDVLELSYSSLTHMAPLCAAGSLRVLNISGNQIASMEDSGLRCSDDYISRLQVLELSNNLLTEIPPWLGQVLPNLQHLGVANNRISQTSDSPFQNLEKLIFLDFSNNTLTRFTDIFFKGCSNLHTLDISMNKVAELQSGLLATLSSLQELNIGSMDLDETVWVQLSALTQLSRLNMSRNRIATINADIINLFSKLEYFYLDNNRINYLPRAAFEYQNSLNSIDLSFNEIPEIPSYAFRNQNVLKYLRLRHNKITVIGFEAFSQLSDLLLFDMNHNNISYVPPKAFSGLTKVEHLDISNNNLTVTDSDVFENNLQLSYLNISYNNLIDVPVLNHLLKLKTIDISYNRISYLNPSCLSDLRDLSTVIISHNQLKSLPIKLFKGCENMKTIDFSFNSIQLLDESIFSGSPRVQKIDLSNNEIKDIGSVFSGLKDLETLDLSYNRIDKVLRGQFPHFIKELNLRGNQIVFITAHTFKSLSRIRVVDLSRNKLTSINRMDVEIAFNMAHVPEFNLRYNPFVCDCKLGWLKDWSMGKLKDTMTLPTFQLNSGFDCISPFYTQKQSLKQLSRAEFLCNYTSFCEESCMCCDYACYCKYVCPPSCSCFIGDNYLHVHQVQCNSANLTSVPRELPEGATVLRLDGNRIDTLHRHEFLALKYVEFLYLNHSKISTIQNDTFKGLKSVRTLYLNNNQLTAIYSTTFQGLDSLEILYLQNNNIVWIDVQIFAIDSSIKTVNLQNNELNTISLEDLQRLSNRTFVGGAKTKFYLSGNPWTCDTDFACKFISFIRSNPELFADTAHIECTYSNGGGQSLEFHSGSMFLLDLQPEFCGVNQSSYGNVTWQNLKGSASKTEIYALIAACVVIVFAFIFLIVIYLNRRLLQVVLFTRFGLRLFKTKPAHDDDDKPYDAFVSYSNKDEDFVLRQLAPRLENGEEKFRLCVHYRDFPVGSCIAETIVRSVEASKRTILVVSDNFLDSEWCRFEFQTAHQQVLTERRNRVILILMHNLDPRKLDDALKIYIKTRTYLKFEDPWFWEKLVFAMPDTRHRKHETASRLHSSRNSEYPPHQRHLLSPQIHQCQQFQLVRNGCRYETILNDVYEVPVVDTLPPHYQLANTVCCSTHTNTAYHNSDCSDSTSGYHNGSVSGSCCHYEEVGPGPVSAQSTPLRQTGTPPPVPLIPKEGFVPRQKLVLLKV